MREREPETLETVVDRIADKVHQLEARVAELLAELEAREARWEQATDTTLRAWLTPTAADCAAAELKQRARSRP